MEQFLPCNTYAFTIQLHKYTQIFILLFIWLYFYTLIQLELKAKLFNITALFVYYY